MSNMGELEVILGPMFSGKTTRLLELYRQYQGIVPTIMINHCSDNRYGETTHVFSHNKDNVPCTSVSTLSSVNIPQDNDEKHTWVILINEGQFFPDLVKYVNKWVNEYKMTVYVCGLDGDYKRNKIGDILELIPMADSIVKLNSICKHCSSKKKAIFTHRISNECEQVVIGSDNYIPVCRNCYELLNK